MNSTFRARWLASSEVIRQVLLTSEQPKKNKMAFFGILSQIKLLFGPLVIQLVWYILKQLFIWVSVKVVDIYLAALWLGKYPPLFTSQLPPFEKTSRKVRKARLDVNFLKSFQSLHAFPKFISFAWRKTYPKDVIRNNYIALSKRDPKNWSDSRMRGTRSEQHSQIIIKLAVETVICLHL